MKVYVAGRAEQGERRVLRSEREVEDFVFCVIGSHVGHLKFDMTDKKERRRGHLCSDKATL